MKSNFTVRQFGRVPFTFYSSTFGHRLVLSSPDLTFSFTLIFLTPEKPVMVILLTSL
jgi:hypothetical protein